MGHDTQFKRSVESGEKNYVKLGHNKKTRFPVQVRHVIVRAPGAQCLLYLLITMTPFQSCRSVSRQKSQVSHLYCYYIIHGTDQAHEISETTGVTFSWRQGTTQPRPPYFLNGFYLYRVGGGEEVSYPTSLLAYRSVSLQVVTLQVCHPTGGYPTGRLAYRWLPYKSVSLQVSYPTSLLPYMSVTLQVCYPTGQLPYKSVSLQVSYPRSLLPYMSVTLQVCYPTCQLPYRSVTLQVCYPTGGYPTSLLPYMSVTLQVCYPTGGYPTSLLAYRWLPYKSVTLQVVTLQVCYPTDGYPTSLLAYKSVTLQVC
ncbi:hypothetical protein Btru_054462 [Bulinus truncatus]|nr:hypothetical protein Btru_054462 [Bulinus truncatus]